MRLCGVCHYLSRQTQNSTGNITAFIYSLYCAKIKQNRETSLHVCNEFNYYCSFLSESEVPDPWPSGTWSLTIRNMEPDHQEHGAWPSGTRSLTFFSVVLDIPTSTMVLYMVPIYTVIWETPRRGQPAFPHPDIWQGLGSPHMHLNIDLSSDCLWDIIQG